MGTSTDEMVKRDARVCVCGKPPVWAKLRGGDVVLACKNLKCKRWPAVRASCVYDAIQNWNQEVANYDAIRKRH